MPQIVPMLPTIGKIGQGVTGGLGVISNLIRGHRLNQAQQAALKRERDLQSLINNPALLAQKVQAMTQPLNQGLVKGVENTAQAGLAERGLGTSPQIANEVFAQALGPYQFQNQQAALRSVLQLYGMDDAAINTILGVEGQPTDTSSFWSMLQAKPNIPTLPPASQIPQSEPTIPATPDFGGVGTGSSFPDLFPPETPSAPQPGFPGSADLWGVA